MSKSVGRSAPEPPIVVSKAYDFALWLLRKVEKFPRSYRFSVGERLVAGALDLLLLVVDAAYASRKVALLDQANRKTNALRYLLRLANDLRLLPAKPYAFAAERLEEIGCMIGGWRKAAERAK